MLARPSDAEVTAILRDAFPDLGAERARYLDSGCDFWAYETDQGHLFRFPQDEVHARRLQTELALLPALAETLPLPVPHYRWMGRAPSFPLPFAGYAKLHGTPADIAPRLDHRACVDAMAAFLSHLHAFDVERAAALGVPADDEPLSLRGERVLAHLDAMETLGVDLTAVRGRLEDCPAEFRGPPVLCHNDLAPEHVLVDEEGRPAGVIDWGDVAIGDAAIDLAGVAFWGGREMLDEVWERYELPLDPGARTRALYLSACAALHTVHLGVAMDRPRWVHAGLNAL